MSLNRKAVQDIITSVEADIISVVDTKITAVMFRLLNLIDLLFSDNELLKEKNQQHKNTINELKGEQGKPEIKENSRNPKNISSENERKNNTHESNNVTEEDNKNNALNVDAESTADVEQKKNKTRQRQPKTCDLQVDREQKCYLDKSTLPADATNKGFSPIIIQDIKIVTDNVRYLRETYYSPSLNKTFTALLPDGIEGQGVWHRCSITYPLI